MLIGESLELFTDFSLLNTLFKIISFFLNFKLLFFNTQNEVKCKKKSINNSNVRYSKFS